MTLEIKLIILILAFVSAKTNIKSQEYFIVSNTNSELYQENCFFYELKNKEQKNDDDPVLNKWILVGFILSLIGFGFLGLILCITGLIQIKQGNGKYKGKVLAIIGICLGILYWIAGILLLFFLLSFILI